MIDLDKLRESEGYMLAIVNTQTGEYEPVSEDVMPVVRCRDCKYYREYAGVVDGYCYMAEWYQYPDDFCSRAERKEE